MSLLRPPTDGLNGIVMDQRFGYCSDCINQDKCRQCYRGSWYQPNPRSDDYFDEDDQEKRSL